MVREIGSNYWLNKDSDLANDNFCLEDYLGFRASDTVFLSTGRSAIAFVLDHINTKNKTGVALLPAFTCYSVIEPFIKAGYKIICYDVDSELKCVINDIEGKVKFLNPDVVLFHGYFGFDTLRCLRGKISFLKRKSITVVEDVTQSLYSKFEHLPADFFIGSLRKWGPLPDGGFALRAYGRFDRSQIKPPDLNLEEVKVRAMHEKYYYMNGLVTDKTEFLEQFKKAEDMIGLQHGFHAMADLSYKVQSVLDFEGLRKRRRANFERLLQMRQIPNAPFIPVFRNLPHDVVPLYFPVFTHVERSRLQDYLAKCDIYCPIIWPKSSYCNAKTSKVVNWIYENILAIPCDQRYDVEDMQRILNALAAFIAKE